MRNNTLNIIICTSIVCLLILGCDGSSDVMGRVFDSNGHPIEKAFVKFEVLDVSKPPVCTTETNKDGWFGCGFIHAPFEVKLKLTVMKEGYETFESEFTSTEAHEKTNRKEEFRIELRKL